MLQELLKISKLPKEKIAEINNFVKLIKKQSSVERDEQKEKKGFFTGVYAINPVNNEEVPVYTANFVLADYGTGIVMAVPAHDQRDFEFAKKYNIPIKVVIQPRGRKLKPDEMNSAYDDEGVLVNSGKFNGLNSMKAIKTISNWLQRKGFGEKVVNYRLKDWLISRQRYWGTPIPVVYCEKCGVVPVPYDELPVLLPRPSEVKFGKGNPLNNENFVNVKCPKCGGLAKRETDTMDTFVDSSWYFLRYVDPKNTEKPFDKHKADYWMSMDFYIGGIEHATGHLIYSRFFTKFIHDLGLLKYEEPAKRLLCQGMVTLGGSAMSKSKGNVVDPLDIIKKYGADATRAYVLFAALPEKDFEWNDKGIEGIFRFINTFFNMAQDIKSRENENVHTKQRPEPKSQKHQKSQKSDIINSFLLSKLQSLIDDVTKNLENIKPNYATQQIMSYFRLVDKFKDKTSINHLTKIIETISLMLNPFTPHLSEEVWHFFHESFASTEKWPKANKKLVNKKVEEIYDAVIKLKQDIINIVNMLRRKNKKPKKVFIYCLPGDIDRFKAFSAELSIGINVELQNSEKPSHDPLDKAQKARPLKPAIYVE